MEKQHEPVKDFIQKNALTLTLQLIAMVVVILNLWLVSKLSPITQDLAVVKTRVSAVEEAQSGFLSTSVGEAITDRLNRIENKLDRLLER